MKATITQRFVTADGITYDVDCDCRFLFFCLRDVDGAWRAKYVKLIYEKDKLIPVDGKSLPQFAPEVLRRYPDGYKFLGAAQNSLGYNIDLHLATVNNHQTWFRMYGCMEKWLNGEDPDLFWEGPAPAGAAPKAKL